MASKTKYSPLAQVMEMRRLYPQFNAETLNSRENIITFTGQLQPHENMPVYTIRVIYRGGKSPRVRVVSPALVENPPHFFHSIQALCLYHPRDFKWTKETSLAQTILPWANAWLYFYEVWKETGEWYGEEALHDEAEVKKEEVEVEQ